MKYYYYPLSSRDFTFENIFSSESISPPCVYYLRTFGTDFFNTLPNLHHPEAIVLYTQPPQYDLSKEKGEYIKFIVKIAENALDPDELITISENIIGYQKTIYFNKSNFELLFFSEKEITICCLKSEATLSTKSYWKYKNNFKIIDSKDCKEFDTEILQTLKISKDWTEVINFDRRFNFFKGYCYGFLCGLLKTLSKKEIELKCCLQDITNKFSEFKTKSLDDSKKKYDRNLIKAKPINDTGSTLKVIDAINNAEKLFKANIPAIEFDAGKVETFLKELLSANGFKEDHINLFVQFKKMEDLILGTGNFTKFKSQYLKSDHKNPILYFEVLKEQVQAFASQITSTTDWARASRDKASDSFKKTMFHLSKVADSQAAKPETSDAARLEKIHYSIETNNLTIEENIGSYTPANFDDYVAIVCIILKNVKLGKGDAAKDDLLKLVDLVASKLNSAKPGTSSHLYQYLNGSINEYDSSKVQSIPMKNFIAFVFNPDSIERMERYLNAKEISDKWMAYSFWSAFNGFANLSRIFVAPYFETNNRAITDPIDVYFSEYYKNKMQIRYEEITKPKETKLEIGKSEENGQAKIEDFYNEFVNEKFKLSLTQFQSIVSLDDPEKMVSELKAKHRIAKRDGVKLIDRFREIVKSPSLF